MSKKLGTLTAEYVCSAVRAGESGVVFVESNTAAAPTPILVSDVSTGVTDIWFDITYFV